MEKSARIFVIINLFIMLRAFVFPPNPSNLPKFLYNIIRPVIPTVCPTIFLLKRTDRAAVENGVIILSSNSPTRSIYRNKN